MNAKYKPKRLDIVTLTEPYTGNKYIGFYSHYSSCTVKLFMAVKEGSDELILMSDGSKINCTGIYLEDVHKATDEEADYLMDIVNRKWADTVRNIAKQYVYEHPEEFEDIKKEALCQ